MRTKSKSPTTTKPIPGTRPLVQRRLPTEVPPVHSGEMLLAKFLKPLGISQSAFAIQLGVSFPRLNEIIRAKPAVTPDTALCLAQVTRMNANFCLGLRQDWDLWRALRSTQAQQIAKLTPFPRAGEDVRDLEAAIYQSQNRKQR
ncbi:MAG TPA: HigA family addiction module antitoxin [Gemmatimonadaceae bacterium]|nr:HigA family addiction module antitoxin [Gemmatimonadaceae bacterium]